MKQITIAGGVTRDAELRRTQQGEAVLGFSVAVSEGFGDKKRTLYFDASLWGTRGEKLAAYLAKGTRVAVSGDLSTREHNGKTYMTVRADQVTLMGGGQRDDGGSRQTDARGAAHASAPIDDDIPF